MDTISVLLPAYNEAERIGATLAALQTLGKAGQIAEIIVVDDGSTDSTASCAEAADQDAVIVFRQRNQGKGAALQAAFGLASGDVLLLLDSDLEATASEAAKLLRPVLSGAADMTIATFPVIPGKGGGFGLAVKLARWGIRKLTGQTMSAPLSGQRALRRRVVETVGGFEAGWGAEVGLTIGALRAGFRVLEIPTQMSHRVTGRDRAGIRHRASQFLAVARVLLHCWRHPNPAQMTRNSTQDGK